jgi:hypothetical protein
MLFFDKSNKRSIKLETAVTWSKSNLNMMNIYEESTINFWICVDFHLVRMTRLWNNRNQESSSRFIHIYFFNSIQLILKNSRFYKLSRVCVLCMLCIDFELNWIECYNWNIVESDVKHNILNPNQYDTKCTSYLCKIH